MARKDRSPNFRDFDDRLRKLRHEAGLPDGEPQVDKSAHSMGGGAGIQVGIELVAGVIGGGLIGYGLDRWLDTGPVLFLVFFFLGAAAGMLNAYRYIKRASESPK